MSFDFSTIGNGEWFVYQDSVVDPETGDVTWLDSDPATDEKVCFRALNPDKFREIKDKYRGKKVNAPVLNTLSKAMEVIATYDQTPAQEKAERMDFWDNAIVDWTIIDTRTKEIIPCTAENKYLMITGIMAFLRFSNRCLQILSGTAIEAEKAKEKN